MSSANQQRGSSANWQTSNNWQFWGTSRYRALPPSLGWGNVTRDGCSAPSSFRAVSAAVIHDHARVHIAWSAGPKHGIYGLSRTPGEWIYIGTCSFGSRTWQEGYAARDARFEEVPEVLGRSWLHLLAHCKINKLAGCQLVLLIILI